MGERIIISKLGVVGAEPFDLYGELSDHFDATHLVPSEIHDDLFLGEDRRSRKNVAKVRAEMLWLARNALESDIPVVFDSHLNNPRHRLRVLDLAKDVGATAVLVHPRASFALVRARIQERHAMNQLYLPNDEMTLEQQLARAGQMSDYVAGDDIDPDRNDVPHLCVDGNLPVDDIIGQVEEYIAEAFSELPAI